MANPVGPLVTAGREWAQRAAQVPAFGLVAASVGRRVGLCAPHSPRQVAGVVDATLSSVARYGPSLACIFSIGAASHPGRLAVIDAAGGASYLQMEQRTSTVAASLADMGVNSTDRVGILCGNGVGFLTAVVAVAKRGAGTVYLNTGLSGRQLAGTVEREGVTVLVADQDLLTAAGGATVVAPGRPVVLAAVDDPAAVAERPTFDRILVSGRRRAPALRWWAWPGAWRSGPEQVILTSGTTGTPKGAKRSLPASPAPVLSLLSRIPLRSGGVTVVSAPMFHAWGLAQALLGVVLGATLVLPRRFDAEDVLRQIEAHQARVLIAVPTMIQRIIALPADVTNGYDTSSLEVVAVSGSALPASVSDQFMDRYGDVLYNLYGSTEVGWATVATPEDLRAAPGTAGRPPVGVSVRVIGPDGRPVEQGRRGRIAVRNGVAFDGYTGGGGKDRIGGHLVTGDLGHFDHAGRLSVEGREDDMIVSGGENVFPREVEDRLLSEPDVVDAAVVGVADEAFGERLVAYVVAAGKRADAGPLAARLSRLVASDLARYKVPREIVVVDSIPRNVTGKVIRHRLAHLPHVGLAISGGDADGPEGA